MYTALYRQWRPKEFDDLKGQGHVATTLRNALMQGRIGHAYLFCGPRGVGKTTVARILARAVNCKKGVTPEPCGECSSCKSILSGSSLDVLEIDAASNRGIDEIRDLRDKVRFYPAECRYKVYIIDEVHMLTSEAFNALLKTLEEPPAHAIFILATTEPHKIPLTILSRCQRFDFHRLEPEEIISQMTEIIQATGSSAEETALLLIARAADGSLRDALSVLDQALTMGEGAVKEATVLTILGVPDKMAVAKTVRAIAAGDAASLFGLVDELLKNGKDLRQFSRDLASYFRDLLLIDTGARVGVKISDEELAEMKEDAALFTRSFLIEALKVFAQSESEMRGSAWPRLVVETSLLGLMSEAHKAGIAATSRPAASAATTSPAPAAASTPAPRASTPSAPGIPAAQSATPAPVGAPSVKPTTAPAAAAPSASATRNAAPTATSAADQADIEALRNSWQTILDAARRERATVAALLQEGKPSSLEGDTLVIVFKHQFHKSALETAENKAVVDRVLKGHFRRSVQVRLELAAPDKPARKDPLDDPLVKGALELFGGEIITEDDSRER